MPTPVPTPAPLIAPTTVQLQTVLNFAEQIKDNMIVIRNRINARIDITPQHLRVPFLLYCAAFDIPGGALENAPYPGDASAIQSTVSHLANLAGSSMYRSFLALAKAKLASNKRMRAMGRADRTEAWRWGREVLERCLEVERLEVDLIQTLARESGQAAVDLPAIMDFLDPAR